MRTLVRLALQTSADRGVMLRGQVTEGLRLRDLEIYHDAHTGKYSGMVHLRDTKAMA